MLPDQTGRLRSPADFSRDGGVADELKDIAEDLGIGVRGELLSVEVERLAAAQDLRLVPTVLERLMPHRVDDDEVVGRLTKRLDHLLPLDKSCEDAGEAVLASVAFCHFLWHARGAGAAELVQTLPIVAANNTAVRWTARKKLIAPVSTWPEAARPYAHAYMPDRIMSDVYVDGVTRDVAPFVAWDVAFAGPLVTSGDNELKGRRLEVAADGEKYDGVTVVDVRMSDIALLRDVFLHCKGNKENSRALLGLILECVVPNDSCWRSFMRVTGRAGGKPIDVVLRPANWLIDLKTYPWVPVEVDEAVAQAYPTPNNIVDLIDPAWLENNPDAIVFLSEQFGCDRLSLQLLGMSDEQKRRSLTDELAKLVADIGADVDAVRERREQHAAAQRRTLTSRAYGGLAWPFRTRCRPHSYDAGCTSPSWTAAMTLRWSCREATTSCKTPAIVSRSESTSWK